MPGLEHPGRDRRRALSPVSQRVRLAMPVAVRIGDVELVRGAAPDTGNEQLPDAGAAEGAHRVRPAVPVIEVTDDPDAAGVGGPYRKRGAAEARLQPGAENVPQLLVPALGDQVQIDLAERGQV